LYQEIYSEKLPVATVRQFIADWLKTKEPEIAPATMHSYRKSTGKLLTYLGNAADRDLVSINRRTLIEFRNSIAVRNAPATVNADIKCLRMLFRTAKRDGYVLDDPAEFVDLVRKDDTTEGRKPFTIEEIQRVIAVADPEWKSLILFGLYTGQRLADLACLTWDNVDLDRNEVRLRTRKTGKRIILPMAKPLRTHIESLPVSDELAAPLHLKAFAMVTRQGRSGNLSNQFGELLAQAGFREKKTHESKKIGRGSKRAANALTFHSLRHTAVSLLKHAGIPEASVMELIGHDSKEMSDHYTHVGREALEKAAAAFPEV
jgi:integrase